MKSIIGVRGDEIKNQTRITWRDLYNQLNNYVESIEIVIEKPSNIQPEIIKEFSKQ